jgi:hypothetical protein
MARFARMTLMKVSQLTRLLEAQLGPGTGELAMRYGLHSGPVTAGVLRGQKARFQLFGDTMNMAARMEQTGLKNKVQMSAETAKILADRGKGHWFHKRNETITVKGKGDCETYWLLLGTSSNSYASTNVSADSENDQQLNSDEVLLNSAEGGKHLNVIWADSAPMKSVFGATSIGSKIERLVDWNTDVLSEYACLNTDLCGKFEVARTNRRSFIIPTVCIFSRSEFASAS